MGRCLPFGCMCSLGVFPALLDGETFAEKKDEGVGVALNTVGRQAFPFGLTSLFSGTDSANG